MKSVVLFLFSLVCLGNFSSHAQNKVKKPNIILVLADDMGVGDVGVYGQQKIKTPNMDGLAKDGIMFTQFYTGTSVCAPSRSALMTGQHTGHTPIRGNKSTKPEGQWPLPEDAVTIAQLLRNAGYATGDFGKWGLGYLGTSGDPNKQGFDEFYGYNCQSLAHDYFPDHLWDNEKRIDLPNTPNNQMAYSGDMIQSRAKDFISKNKTKPFFLFLSYTLPHAALQLPKDDSLFQYYKQVFNEQPKAFAKKWTGVGYEPQAYPHAAYAAMVGKFDAYIGEIRSELERLGLDKNTLIIVASDNGPHKEGGNDPAFFNSSAGLRGIKRDLYEGGIRTPLIAYWPGKIKAGSVSDFKGAFWDLLPTFTDLAGAKTPKNIDGISIAPTLLGKSKQKQHDHLYWEFHEQGGKQAVLYKNWKGVRLKAMLNPDEPIELYDLSSDPSEKQNIASLHPEIVKKIESFMKADHVESADFPFWKSTAQK